MDYSKGAEELLKYLIESERNGYIIQGNISEIAKGEIAVINFLRVEGDGVTPARISQEFNINTSRVAAILNSLSKKGYIERKANPNDKRKTNVYITDQGREYGKCKRDDILEKLSRTLELLGDDDAKEYIRIMGKIKNIIFEEQMKG